MLNINKRTGTWSYTDKLEKERSSATTTGMPSMPSMPSMQNIYKSIMKNVQFKEKRISFDKWYSQNEEHIEHIVDTLYDSISSFTYETDKDEFLYTNIVGENLRHDLTMWLYNNSINSLSKCN